MPRVQRATGVLAALLLSASAGGCGAADGATAPPETVATLESVRVTGALGEEPTVSFEKPLTIEESGWRTLVEGDGPGVRPDRPMLLQITLVNARTGDLAVTTSSEGESARTVRPGGDDLFPVLDAALVDAAQGDRILVGAAPEDAYADAGAPQYDIGPGDSVLMIADVMAVAPDEVLDGPEGVGQELPSGLPQVIEHAGVVQGVRFERDLPTPRRLRTTVLIEGSGDPVRADSLVTLDAVGQLWNSPDVVSSTYLEDPVTVAIGAGNGNGNVIAAWERALVGVPAGSRVMLVTPPHLAYQHTGSPPSIPGDATLVYVIDVLGVS